MSELPFKAIFNCSTCHSNANDSDYELIKVGVNLNNVAVKVHLLSKCRHCYKFKREKGSLSINVFYSKLNESIL